MDVHVLLSDYSMNQIFSNCLHRTWLPNNYESSSFSEFAEHLSLFFFSNEKDN